MHYITKTDGTRINISFVPPKVLVVVDKYILLNRIFGDELSDEYSNIYDVIAMAIDYPKIPGYWEEVGNLLMGLHDYKYDTWANHFFKVASKIEERKPHTRHKKLFPFHPLDGGVRKMDRLIKGIPYHASL